MAALIVLYPAVNVFAVLCLCLHHLLRKKAVVYVIMVQMAHPDQKQKPSLEKNPLFLMEPLTDQKPYVAPGFGINFRAKLARYLGYSRN